MCFACRFDAWRKVTLACWKWAKINPKETTQKYCSTEKKGLTKSSTVTELVMIYMCPNGWLLSFWPQNYRRKRGKLKLAGGKAASSRLQTTDNCLFAEFPFGDTRYWQGTRHTNPLPHTHKEPTWHCFWSLRLTPSLPNRNSRKKKNLFHSTYFSKHRARFQPQKLNHLYFLTTQSQLQTTNF